MRVIETQSRLLQSHDLARRVVQQLGLEQLRPEVSETVQRLKETKDQTDRLPRGCCAACRLRAIPRAYLITVRYTARDPALAVAITNAFVAEFLRSSKLQTLSQQRSSAEATLSRQLAKFGEKHPRVAERGHSWQPWMTL